MNFFHIPSFEDHYTLKIWLKNWNLPINNTLFKMIHQINDLFNKVVDTEALKSCIDYELLQEMFPYKKWLEDKLKFQIYAKEDTPVKDDMASHFYRNMHFMIAIVSITSSKESEINQLIESVKKFAFLKDIKSLIILAECKSEQARKAILKISNAVVIGDIGEINEAMFRSSIMPVFMKGLKDKLVDIPKIDRHKIVCPLDEFMGLLKKKPSSFSEGKILKLRGDVAFILGSSHDALNYYNKALEVFSIEKRNTGSSKAMGLVRIWIGSVIESIGACHYTNVKQNITDASHNSEKAQQDIVEVSKRAKDALHIYVSEGHTLMVYELRLKLLGYYSLLKNRIAFIRQFNSLKNDENQLELDPRILLYLGDLANNTGLTRLAVSILYDCSRRLKRSAELDAIKYESLQYCAKILKIDLDSYQNNFELMDEIPKQITYIVLVNLLDFSTATRNNARTLHYYLLLMRRFETEKTFKKITEMIMWENPFYVHEYDTLPFIQRLVPESREKEYRALNPDLSNAENIGESVFIYDPRSRNKYVDLNWVCDEEATITIYITNPLSLYVKIDSISLETEGVDVSNYSKDLNLSPYAKNVECKFKARPLKSGKMTIKGVKMRIGNLIYVNSVDNRGIGSIYKYIKADNPYIYDQYYITNDINLESINISESVPVINIENLNYCPETLFYNENVKIQYRLTNSSKSDAVDFRITVKIDYENAYTVNLDQTFENLVMANNQFVDFDFCLYQGQGGQDNHDTDAIFELLDNDRIVCYFENRNLIERVYKITIVIESRFRDNKDYVSSKEIIRIFKVA